MKRVKTLKKAIFPAAGLGTRILPATKSTPKETIAIGTIKSVINPPLKPKTNVIPFSHIINEISPTPTKTIAT